MAESFYRKLPIKVILVWMVIVAICYNMLQNGTGTFTSHELIDIPPSHVVDAIVFIAMGKMASDPMVDYAIASARMIGKWKGDIFVVTDRPACFAEAVKEYEIGTIEVPAAKSLVEIKALKPQLMSLLPASTRGILYIDVDILVARNLTPFLRDLGSMIYLEHSAQTAAKAAAIATATATATAAGASASPSVSPDSPDKRQGPPAPAVAAGGAEGSKEGSEAALVDPVPAGSAALVPVPVPVPVDIDPMFDFAAFLDAKGHYVGFCAGCEKWHSGVSVGGEIGIRGAWELAAEHCHCHCTDVRHCPPLSASPPLTHNSLMRFLCCSVALPV
jgi:hypothetical protein